LKLTLDEYPNCSRPLAANSLQTIETNMDTSWAQFDGRHIIEKLLCGPQLLGVRTSRSNGTVHASPLSIATLAQCFDRRGMAPQL